MMDLFGDAQIHSWKAWLAMWYNLTPAKADAHIAALRGPASDLAAALNLDPMAVALDVSRIVYTDWEGMAT